MPEIEKVIKGLECCVDYPAKWADDCGDHGCPYASHEKTCITDLQRDVLELLKAQILTVEPKRIDLADETKAWLDKMDAVDALGNIANICIDWDGYRTANGLGGLINEVWAYARYCANNLLKAQEPRVMTLEEVKQERICWIEDADDGMTVRLFPATMFGIGEYANGSKSYMFLAQKPWAIDANDCEWWYLIEDYGEIWRCWTSRPTDEQREAVPWEK